MSIFRPGSTRQHEIGLAIVRVLTGVIFLAHGAQKLFVYGFDGVSGAFGQMGIPMAGVVGPLVALLEFFGGLALIAGFLTRPVALGLAFNMLGAIAFVHAKAGFFLPNGSEFVLILLGATTALTLAGAGAFSLDALISRRHESADALTSETMVPTPATTRKAA